MPVIIIHLYISVGQEGDWLLHMHALHRMTPLFFAAAHWNYAKYIFRHIIARAAFLQKLSCLHFWIRSLFVIIEVACGMLYSWSIWQANIPLIWESQGESHRKNTVVRRSCRMATVTSSMLFSVCSCETLVWWWKQRYRKCEIKYGCHKEGKPWMKINAKGRQNIDELRRCTNPLFTSPEEPLHNIINSTIAKTKVNAG